MHKTERERERERERETPVPKRQYVRHIHAEVCMTKGRHLRTCQDIRMENLAYAAHVVFEVLQTPERSEHMFYTWLGMHRSLFPLSG
jgi:hypothetical protein